jgi:NADH dehydrogenase (ubiquinone) 1 alpha subcomplex subunit 10
MASAPIRLGLKFAGGKKNVSASSRVILCSKFGQLDVLSAGITGRTARTGDPPPKPEPWPYLEKGYSNWTFWIDKTLKRFDDNTKLITVEGPPAAGKTQLAKALAEELEFKYFPMVTMDYRYINSYGFDIRTVDERLPKACRYMDERRFIENPRQENAPSMIFSLLQTKYSQYMDVLMHMFNTGQGVVMERCPYTDLAFADAAARVGYLDKQERLGYERHYNAAIPDLLRPHLIIYLDASVDTVLNNFKKRGLGEEKTYNEDYLSTLEDSYKRKVLVELEKHAEMLVYDWNSPGDFEAVVEDIERINFEPFFVNYSWRDEKMKDWRFEKDEEASEMRWKYTHTKPRLMCNFNVPLLDCPRLYMSGEDVEQLKDVWATLPGHRYRKGFDPALDEKITFKNKLKSPQVLPPCVTDYLLGKTPKPNLPASS